MFRSRNEKAGSQLCEEEASFCFIIGVRGKACAPQLMLLSIGFPDEKQFKGACPKSRRDDKKKPRRGDRVLNMLFANQLDVLSPLRGFCFVDVPEPGVSTPVCVLSHLRCLFTGEQYYFIYIAVRFSPLTPWLRRIITVTSSPSLLLYCDSDGCEVMSG